VDLLEVVEDFAVGLACGDELFDFEAHLESDLAAVDRDGFGPAAWGEQRILEVADSLRIGGGEQESWGEEEE
jgi:hypothetical protein